MSMTRSRSPCLGPLDRRAWLKIGGLSLGALASEFNPNLANLLAADETTGRRTDGDFSVILFWANGGPSQLETFDLKPDAPDAIRGPFRPRQTNVAGMQITELLPTLAGMADKFTLVRSLRHNRGEHSGGTHRFLTGHSSIAANLNDAEYPDIGSIVARQLESQAPRDVPLYVGSTKFYGSGPAYLGPAYAPYMPSPNPLSSTGANAYDPIPLYLTPESQANLALSADGTVTLRRRRDLLQSLDALPRLVERRGSLAAFDGFQRRAIEILAGQRTREAFDLSRESLATRERYGDTHWGKSLLTCRRLVEAGVRFVQCQAEFRLDPAVGSITTFDDHSINADIFGAYRAKMPHFDRSVSALIEDLYQRGLDRRVLFIFCGEFGRSPRIEYENPVGNAGRDHWPRSMSIFLSGGGLRMGQVIGATNPRGEEPTVRPMDSNCLLATIYHKFGIDTNHHLHDRAGRPIPILPSGEPIGELL